MFVHFKSGDQRLYVSTEGDGVVIEVFHTDGRLVTRHVLTKGQASELTAFLSMKGF